MKICLITNLYEPYARGGAEVIVKRTAQALVKDGHDVVVITAQPYAGWSSMTPQASENDGVRVYRFYQPNLYFYAHDYRHSWPVRLIWHALDIFNWPSSRSVECILRKEEPDLVITHNLMGLGFLVPGCIRKLKLRHIHVLHDIQLAVRSGVMLKGQESSWRVKGLPALAYQAMTRRLFGSPQAVISPSQFLLDFYQRQGFFPHSQLRLIRNPVSERFFSVVHQEDPETVRFLYIGQYAEHKGVLELAQAFNAMPAANARLTFIGGGPLQRELLTFAQKDKRIQVLPRINNEDLPGVFAQADAVVLPTKTYENSPTVVLEALASGLPVIATDIGGSAELISDTVDGYVVGCGDVGTLRNGMESFMRLSPEQRQAMGTAGRKKIAPHTSEAYVRKLLAS